MKKIKKCVLSLCIVGMFGVTACSNQGEGTGLQIEKIDSNQVASNESETSDNTYSETDTSGKTSSATEPTIPVGDNANESNGTKSHGDSSQELFENAKLDGRIVNLSGTEMQLSIVVSSKEDGGEVAAVAAPGMENEDELVHVAYDDNTKVSILTMDLASQKQISLETGQKSDIVEQVEVLVFGSCQDTYHWTADEVVITKWQ